ncbi:substrate-binding periplasmic protein [Novispirillum itersonii]|uniref:Polar amino acid transport system substrate-binding protein n=1 Tax=Novispirillum itersonii TaxID=189 RepID=A0A7W9ZI04_NOVIT|nr:transporter substrate-binding domain-containing protein [Novispirillum itersonii]MBB6211002.1 polar amino acid transport system substrate-binding protein [Novispirillum itersonii]
MRQGKTHSPARRLMPGAVVLMALMGGAAPALAADLACPDFAPFKMTGIPNSRPGIDVEVLGAVFASVQEPVRFQPVPWKRGLELARAGRVDGLCGCSRRPEREQEFLFSDVLGEHHQGLFTRGNGADSPYKALTDLKGRMVAVVRGYALQKDLQDSGAEVMEVVDDAQLVRVLSSGRVDAVYTYRDVFRYHVGQLGIPEGFIYHPIRVESYYLCLSRVLPSSADLMDRFNRGLKDLRQSGGYQKIWDSYGSGS